MNNHMPTILKMKLFFHSQTGFNGATNGKGKVINYSYLGNIYSLLTNTLRNTTAHLSRGITRLGTTALYVIPSACAGN